MAANDFGIDSDAVTGFLDEAGVHIATLNDRLLAVEQRAIGPDDIAEMFRAAHSLKGAAGFLKLTDIAQVTHLMESVLDLIRHGKVTFTSLVVDALFRSFDTVSSLMADVAGSCTSQVDIQPALRLLEGVLGAPAAPVGPPTAAPAVLPQPALPAELPSLPPRAYDPVAEHLGQAPSWLHGRLDEEDICETMVAMGEGKQAVALLFEADSLLHFSRGATAAMDAISQGVGIRRIIQLVSGPEDLWAPLRDFQLRIGVFGFCAGDAAVLLAALEVPPGEAWLLSGPGSTSEAMRIGRDPAKASRRHERLAVKPDMARHLPLWIGTSREALTELDASLLACEGSPEEMLHVDAVFRHLHSLKGASASMGLDEMARLSHQGESLLAAIRDGRMRLDAGVMSDLFATKDALQTCIDRVERGEESSPDCAALDDACARQLAKAAAQQASLPLWSPSEQELSAARAACTGQPLWKVRLVLAAHTQLPDLRFRMILENLGKVATIHHSRPTRGDLEKGTGASLSLCAVISSLAPLAELIEAITCDLVRDWSIDPLAAGEAPARSAGGPNASVQPEAKVAAGHGVAAADTVRVDTMRLDHLLNTAGELAITKARLTQQVDTLVRLLDGVDARALEQLAVGDGGGTASARQLSSISLLRRAQDEIRRTRDTTLELHRHTSAMQHSVMQSRMVPIGPLFQRFHRLVRDLCKERGRDAKLVTSGDSTELDKKLIDEIGDPLTHLIRNGIDHGMETPAERVAAGKAPQGMVHLEAFHRGSTICIQVRDDGRGLSVERIRSKAIERGLVTAEAANRMTNEEIYQFIFLPGFSTAAAITNISGRGVGMDIVRSKVLSLKGTIAIASEPGKGATFTIALPLTLAMIDSLLVKIGDARFAFPLDCVREIVEIDGREVRSVDGKGRVIFLRDQVISLVDLQRVVGIVPLAAAGGLLRAVITKGGSETIAIAVDQVIGDEEIVVKPLGAQFNRVRGLSGATVLGDGGVALILDIHGIHDLACAKRPLLSAGA